MTALPAADTVAPLLLTDDEDLLGSLLPLAAAADVVPQTARHPREALPAWARSPLVLVGADQAPAMARLAPERRPRLYVVSHRRVPDEMFRTALTLGAEQVVELPGSAGWLTELLADVTEQRPGAGRVVGVVGGSGGSGATILACALGQWAARSGDAALIDCDPQGPGLDRVLGLERTEGFRWDALCQTTGRLSARALREALPRRDTLGVLSWYAGEEPRTLQAFAAREALSAARRGHRTVVLDLPRSPDALVDEIAARCDLLVIVTVASVLGVAATARLCSRFAGTTETGLLLRGDALPAREVERVVRQPVLTQMSDQRNLDEAIDLGHGPLRSLRGPLARASAALLD